MQTIHIQALGEFSLRAGDKTITQTGSRSGKAWLLLSFLLCYRKSILSQKKLIEVLWGEDPAISNPENTLRITFHRARTLLNELWPNAGHDLILRKDTGYCWNDQIPLTLDWEDFEALCCAKAEDPEQRLQTCLEALALYRGEFLENQSSEPWVIPMNTHLQNLFLQTALEASELLSLRNRHREAAEICRRAAAREPYHEPLHQMFIKTLAAAGEIRAAEGVYEALSRRLFDDFGIRPSPQTRSVYREAVHSPSQQTLPMDEILEDIQESAPASGAMQCDYDHFKVLCYAEARAIARRGNATHVVLLSISGVDGAILSRRAQNRIMEQLGLQIREKLRRGDVFSRCSVSQYVLMLPQSNYENSCMVARRLMSAYRHAHPHVAVTLHFLVQPLTPSICMP